MKYGIVGDGRVAKHFIFYLSMLNINCKIWSRKNNSMQEINLIFDDCDIIFILVKDSAIEEIAEKLKILNKILIHFSGSLISNLAFSAHPLMTFNEDLYDFETYKSIPFVVDNNDIIKKKYLVDFPNKVYFLNKELKPLYHSLCVIGGNFSCILWQGVIENFSRELKLPKEILIPFIIQIFSNILRDEKKALTGPLIRGDEMTIKKNLDALCNKPEKELYEAFIKYYRSKK
jgi:predicted short-subunit dehydrogenase-like oxidoreductase (DUF2520 family)